MSSQSSELRSLLHLSSDPGLPIRRVEGNDFIVHVPQGRELAASQRWSRWALSVDGTAVELANLRVAELSITDGETVARFTIEDPKSQARAWSFLYEAKRKLPGATPPPEEVESLLMPFRGHYTREAWVKRAAWTRSVVRDDLAALTDIRLDPAATQGHVEHFIGTVEIPVGLVGPLLMHGTNVEGHAYAPFATTEGALVASATRGAAALTRSGGVFTHVVHQRMNRGPVFVMKDMASAVRLEAWLLDHEELIRQQAQSVSRHAKLLSLEPIVIGRYLHVRFVYETGDAAGQNMTTMTTWRACQFVRAQLMLHPEIALESFFIEGNTSGDKKAAHISSMAGRGTRVSAEALIPAKVLQRCLKVSPKVLIDAYLSGMVGSAYVGMMGVNVNVANAIAAIFTATGQDIASVHESSVCQLHLQHRADGVYASILLPSLVVGTVGGGTSLPTQSDGLRIMGCLGPGRSARLAEMIAGFALALELSTLSAIATGDFVAAHEALGRPNNATGISLDELTPARFQEIVGDRLGDPSTGPLAVTGAQPRELANNDSILSQLSGGGTRRVVGLFPYDLAWTRGAESGVCPVIVKSKATDTEVIAIMNSMAKLCGDPIATLHDVHRTETGFRNCHRRELAFAEMDDPALAAIAPRFYGTMRRDPGRDGKGGAFVLLMEHLQNVTNLGVVNDPGAWTDAHLRVALRDIARFHAAFIGRAEGLAERLYLEQTDVADALALSQLWEAVLRHSAVEMPLAYTPSRVAMLERALAATDARWVALSRAPQTVIHNDFNTRNICLRQGSDGARLCAFDWELATVGVPQRDVCELLAYALPPGTPREQRDALLEVHRTELERVSGLSFPKDEYRQVHDLACIELALGRLALVTVGHVFRSYDFLPRVLESHFAYVESVSN